MADAVRELARHAVNCRYDDIPKESINFAKMSFLDTLGTIIAGAPADGCEAVVNRVLDWGGKEESSLFMYKGKVPAHNAALANSVIARAVDFCDSMDSGIHLSSGVIPVGLAMAERAGGVSGKEFLAAIVVAEDIAGRINSATNKYHGFDPTLVCTVFATTVMAGKLMKLNEKEMENALGLAFNESSGTFQSNIDGVLSVRFNQGLASQAGIVCAEFAKDGLTGVKNVFDGVYGYFNLFSRGDSLPEHLLTDLGKTFYINRNVFKRFPSCGATLSATDSAVEIASQLSFDPNEIEKITIRVGTFVNNLVGGRFTIGENPVVDAQFNIRYAVGNALMRKYPTLQHFTPVFIKNPELLHLIDKVEVNLDESDPSLNEYPYHLTAEVTVQLTSGEQFTDRTSHWKGHRLNPMSMDDIIKKFQSNVDFAREWFNPDLADDIVKLVTIAENSPDITAILPFLQGELETVHG